MKINTKQKIAKFKIIRYLMPQLPFSSALKELTPAASYRSLLVNKCCVQIYRNQENFKWYMNAIQDMKKQYLHVLSSLGTHYPDCYYPCYLFPKGEKNCFLVA